MENEPTTEDKIVVLADWMKKFREADYRKPWPDSNFDTELTFTRYYHFDPMIEDFKKYHIINTSEEEKLSELFEIADDYHKNKIPMDTYLNHLLLGLIEKM